MMNTTAPAEPRALLGAPSRFEIVPVPKPRQTRSDKWKTRPAVLRYRAFADELRSQVKGTLEPRLWITFFMPMPASWSGKKRVMMRGKPHQQKPDIDNLAKAFLDALCEDDSYVWELHAAKVWAEAGAIEVYEYLPG